jgi:GDP-L-fucose synthase
MNKDSKILVTGARGFLGKHVCAELKKQGYENIIECASNKTQNHYYIDAKTNIHHCDLRCKTSAAALVKFVNPDVVIHLAAVVGGIGANKENPATFIHDNLVMGINIIEACKSSTYRPINLEKFILVGTVCSYPKYARVPFEEYAIWEGYPEETNAPYGIAKKTLSVMLSAYREQYGLNGITVIPVNMYGPHDNFKPESSHVIPALIKKIHEAGERGSLEIWGSGNATREFLHAEDCARGIILAMESSYSSDEPINIGTYNEVRICDLVHMLRDIMGHKGQVVYDKSKPDGQPRRCLNIAKAKKELGFKPQISLEEGLIETVGWYLKNVTTI